MRQEVTTPFGMSVSNIHAGAERNMVGLVWFLFICCVNVSVVNSQACTVCKGGGEITNPNQEISIPEGSGSPIAIDNCATLDRIAGFVAAESVECEGIQLFGDLCGCPSPSTPPPLASITLCTLCLNGYQLRNSSLIISSNSTTNSTMDAQESLMLQLSIYSGGTEPTTCGVMEQFVATRNISEGECAVAQSFVDTCGGCFPINETVLEEQDQEKEEEDSVEMCSLCLDGAPTPWPDKTIENFSPSLPNCGGLDLAASSVPLDSDECFLFQGLGKLCGCNMPSSSCSICGDREMTRPDAMYAWANQGKAAESVGGGGDGLSDTELSCEVFDSVLGSFVDDDEQACLVFQLRGASCGCPDTRDTISDVLRRTAAALSLLGSLFIVWNVLRNTKRRSSTHHQIVLGISCFDIISSVANLLGTIPLPERSGTPGALGNADSCTALGFFAQLGQTACYFNLTLSLYSWVVICLKWTETRLRRIRYRVYAAVVFISLVLSFAGLPYYEFGFHYCHVVPPPVAATWLPSVIFFVTPLSIVLAGTTVSTLLVLMEVRRREKASLRFRSRHRFGDDQMHLTARVFWKSVWYLAGFYLVYPILFATFFIDLTSNTFWLYYLSSAFGPSQGFWNFCVYVYTHRRSDLRTGSTAFTPSDRNSSTPTERRSSLGGESNRTRRKRNSTSTIEEVVSADASLSNSGLGDQEGGSKHEGDGSKLGTRQEDILAVPMALTDQSDGDTNDLESDSQILEDCDDDECNAYSTHYHSTRPMFG